MKSLLCCAAAVLTVSAALAGCSSSGGNSSAGASQPASQAVTQAAVAASTAAAAPTTTAQQAPTCSGEKVSFQLAFFPNAEFAGFLVAESRGYYKDAGLDVEVKAGGPAITPETVLAQGSVDIGLVDSSSLVAKLKGAPITLVGETFRVDPEAIVALASSGIRKPADLKGKTIGLQEAGAHPDVDALLKAGGLTESDVKFKSVAFGIDGIEGKKVDIGTQQLFFHKALWIDAGYAWPADGQTTSSGPKGLTVFQPKDFGNEGFGEAIAVNNTFLKDHPDAVSCFLSASLRGWKVAISDPDSAIDDVMKYVPKGVSPRSDQLIDLKTTNELMLPSGTPESDLLRIDDATVQKTADFLKQYGVLKGSIDVSSFVNTTLLK